MITETVGYANLAINYVACGNREMHSERIKCCHSCIISCTILAKQENFYNIAHVRNISLHTT